MDENEQYFWGKYKAFDGKTQMVWIGPMTKEQMLDEYEEFRHNQLKMNNGILNVAESDVWKNEIPGDEYSRTN